jgi:hypothetical protein
VKPKVSAKWYYNRNDQVLGPYTVEEIDQLYREKVLSADDEVFLENRSGKRAVTSVLDLTKATFDPKVGLLNAFIAVRQKDDQEKLDLSQQGAPLDEFVHKTSQDWLATRVRLWVVFAAAVMSIMWVVILVSNRSKVAPQAVVAEGPPKTKKSLAPPDSQPPPVATRVDPVPPPVVAPAAAPVPVPAKPAPVEPAPSKPSDDPQQANPDRDPEEDDPDREPASEEFGELPGEGPLPNPENTEGDNAHPDRHDQDRQERLDRADHSDRGDHQDNPDN